MFSYDQPPNCRIFAEKRKLIGGNQSNIFQPERQRQHDSGLAGESQRTTRKLIHLGGKYRQTTSLLD